MILSRFLSSALLAALIAVADIGCATRNHLAPLVASPVNAAYRDAFARAQQTSAHLYPANYRSTHRAIITTGGRQFTCDGLLSVSPADGWHLALVSSFGVVTDLRLKPDGGVELLKVTPIFREDWSRNFVARDLRRLFIPPANLQPAGELSDGRLLLQTAPEADGATVLCVFSADGSRWLELDLARNGRPYYRVVVKRYGHFPGSPEVPVEFEVAAESYELELRVAALTTEAAR